MGAILRGLAVLVQTIAVYGLVTSGIRTLAHGFYGVQMARSYNAFLGGWPMALVFLSLAWWLLAMPGILWWSLVANVPGLWRNPQASRRMKVLLTVGLLIGVSVLAELWASGVFNAMAWAVDRNCWRALEIGVTGSRPCE
jgi:hypothetical protein